MSKKRGPHLELFIDDDPLPLSVDKIADRFGVNPATIYAARLRATARDDASFEIKGHRIYISEPAKGNRHPALLVPIAGPYARELQALKADALEYRKVIAALERDLEAQGRALRKLQTEIEKLKKEIA